jgi:DNA (cytosine-5)-methyltransferase 1
LSIVRSLKRQVELSLGTDEVIETVKRIDGAIYRCVRRRDGSETLTTFPSPPARRGRPSKNINDADADKALLTASSKPKRNSSSEVVSVVDLFCGIGGMSIGAEEAIRALGMDAHIQCAIDFDQTCIDLYSQNFRAAAVERMDLSEFSSMLGSPRTPAELKVCRLVQTPPDILLGGPPCQGHSNLNNHTRRSDPKNELYFKMVRAAELLKPRVILIENVPSVVNDKSKVVARAVQGLSKLGYAVTEGVVDVSHLGVAQVRKRHILLATSLADERFKNIALPTVAELVSRHRVPPRPVMWAIDDLIDIERGELIDEVFGMTEETRQRIDFLFDNNLYELPDHQRPACHKNGHTYPSVYGRIYPDRPSPTITGGFFTMGQGRFVHPSRRSTLTAHEAARIQFLPDWYDWSKLETRQALSKTIGNAVPPKLSYTFILEVFR